MNTGVRCALCGELYNYFHSCPKPALPQIPVGWKCPQCQNIHAPAVLSCPNCKPPFAFNMWTNLK